MVETSSEAQHILKGFNDAIAALNLSIVEVKQSIAQLTDQCRERFIKDESEITKIDNVEKAVITKLQEIGSEISQIHSSINIGSSPASRHTEANVIQDLGTAVYGHVNSSTYGHHPKPRKPSVYTGGNLNDPEPLDTFIFEVERFSKEYGICEDKQIISIAVQYISGDASIWYQRRIKESGECQSWELFQSELKNNFLPAPVEQVTFNKLEMLKCRNIKHLDKYIQKFGTLVKQLPKLPESVLIRYFLIGLLDMNCRRYVELQSPNTLMKAISLTCSYKMTDTTIAKVNRNYVPPLNESKEVTEVVETTTNNEDDPMEIGNIRIRRNGTSNRFNGTCFVCGKRGHKANTCIKRKVGINSIQVGEEDSTDENSDESNE